MKVSLNWIKKYAPVHVDKDAYQSRMIMTGTGIEEVIDLSEKLQNVVVGKVLTCKDHENSDHLHVCTVDVGDEILQIVCGAPNVKEGILAPVAKVGAVLPDGTKIQKGKLRGVESMGMLCGATEIGVPNELYPSVGEAGLLIFNEEYALGTNVNEIFGFNDHVVDFEILANRPDCLSVWGVARETAAAFDVPLTLPSTEVKKLDHGDVHDFAKVDVLNNTLCTRYTAAVVQNVRLAPSPMWLRQYLHAAGMRSINNIVDITNFVMLETGHPMHAFDLDKVQNGHIIVRNAHEGEVLKTLDGKSHTLKGSELLICDENCPTGLAGIMGGEESEITESTQTLLFEVASFDRASVRTTARSLGIRTESSGRFERGVSERTVLEGLNRALQMINELDAGDVVPGIIDIYPNEKPLPTIVCSVHKLSERAGVEITGEEAVQILEKLCFTCTLDGDCLTVVPPEFRQDVDCDADICEEVLRYKGYDLIPSTPLRGTADGGLNAQTKQNNALRALLSGFGFYETMSFSFISQKKLDMLCLPKEDVRLKPLPLLNPLGEDTSVMRTTLLCGQLTIASTNMAHGNSEGRIYEIGKIFDGQKKTEENLPLETPALCMTAWGEEDFFSMRSYVETILTQLGVVYEICDTEDQAFHPGRRAALVSNGKVVAVLGEVHPDVMEKYDLSKKTYAAHMDLSILFAQENIMGHVKTPARFPAVTRDIALVMENSQPVGPMMKAMKEVSNHLLEEIQMFDVFRGTQVGENKKSVAFSLSFRSKDHTLTEEEISAQMNKVLELMKDKFNAFIRS